jgi:hypothetical protein
MFDGGIRFTLRKRIPASTVLDDTDDDVVAQVSDAPGGGIVFSSETDFEVVIPGSLTNTWPLKPTHWDMQGIILATPNNRVLDIAWGTVPVQGDVGRSQTPQ